MACALCFEDKVLRNSHIYPEWIYAPLYDEKRRLRVLSIIPSDRNELKQKGMREYLLCDDCEQMISVWEGYARSVFFAPKRPLDVSQTGQIIRIRGLDYTKLKLFELSILWRAGVSKLAFFNKIQLGPAHEESLRRLLLAGDPGDPDRYGALMFGLKVGALSETLQVIAEPQPVCSHGIKAYKLMFGGFLWVFHVSSTDSPTLIQQCFLRDDGSRIISIRNALEMDNLSAFASRLRQLGRTQ